MISSGSIFGFLFKPDNPSFSPEETMPLWKSILHDFLSLFTAGIWRPFSIRRGVRKEAEAVRDRFMRDMREEASRLASRVFDEAFLIAAREGKTASAAVSEAMSVIQDRIYANSDMKKESVKSDRVLPVMASVAAIHHLASTPVAGEAESRLRAIAEECEIILPELKTDDVSDID